MLIDRTTLRRDLLRFEYEMCIDMFKNTKITKYIIRKYLLYTAKNIIECTVPDVRSRLLNYLQRYKIDISHLRVIASMKESIKYLKNIENQEEQDREINKFLIVLSIYRKVIQ